jgi:phosphatidylethanolamine/phosphatidyl-N-methylethanolamine N-methyltransferase
MPTRSSTQSQSARSSTKAGAVRRAQPSATLIEPKPSKPSGLVFLKEFIRAPKLVGTAFASSPKVSKALVEHVDLSRARVVVELGAGTGAVTREILSRLAPGATFIAVEYSPLLAADFRRRFPGVRLVEGDAAELPSICKSAGIEPGQVDAIISGLPWMLFSEAQRASMMQTIRAMLRPSGVLSLLSQRAAGLPGVAGFRDLMRGVFGNVEVYKSVWSALPPSFIYRCVKMA